MILNHQKGHWVAVSRRKLEMRKEFDVGGIHYVLCYHETSQEITLHIDALKSQRKVYSQTPFERAFGDEPPDTIWFISEHVQTGQVFKILSEVRSFIASVIARYQPYFFVYSANEKAKASVYRRFAVRIANQFGYLLYEQRPGVYRFYKLEAPVA